MSVLSYWDQLVNLKLCSMERCFKHYQVIYTWRIIEGQVPNIDCTSIQSFRQSGSHLFLPKVPTSSMCYPSTCRGTQGCQMSHNWICYVNCMSVTEIFKKFQLKYWNLSLFSCHFWTKILKCVSFWPKLLKFWPFFTEVGLAVLGALPGCTTERFISELDCYLAILYQLSPWCQASPSTGDVIAIQLYRLNKLSIRASTGQAAPAELEEVVSHRVGASTQITSTSTSTLLSMSTSTSTEKMCEYEYFSLSTSTSTSYPKY